jgi:hypothetical protein
MCELRTGCFQILMLLRLLLLLHHRGVKMAYWRLFDDRPLSRWMPQN